MLFENNIETNTTNLRDLAFELGVVLPGARTLKERCILIPLQSYLIAQDYEKIFRILVDANQLECDRAMEMYKSYANTVALGTRKG